MAATSPEAKARQLARQRVWRAENADKRRAYYLAHREEFKAAGQRYRAQNAEKIKAADKVRYAKVKADPAALAKKREGIRRYKKGPKGRAKQRAYDAAHRVQTRARCRAWYQKLKLDPQRLAHYAEVWRLNARANYLKIISDPARYEQHLSKRRTYERGQRTSSRAPMGPSAYPYSQRDSMTAQVLALIPRSVHPEIRGDLCQDLIAACLAGDLTMEQIPAALKSYARKARKLLAETWQQVSLDEEIPGMNGLRRIDTIDSETSIYEATAYK